MQEEISFPYSKARIISGFVLMTVLVLLFFLIFIGSVVYGNYLGVIVGAFFLILFFLAWLDQYKFLRKSLQGLPALLLTSHALIDNTNNISFAWKDIFAFKESSVNMGKGGRKSYIAISLNNEADYLCLIDSWKDKLVARLNSRFFGGAFSIETNAIKEKKLVILNSLNEFKNKYSN